MSDGAVGPDHGNFAPVGYQSVMTQLASAMFRSDHPSTDLNVFLMMRFGPSPLRTNIHRTVSTSAHALGLDLIRADDRDYSGELWTNVKLCMDNCALGIAVFEGGEHETQNLAVELGYLFAKETPCLILRESSLAAPPAMLTHRLHAPFDALDLDGTLRPAVDRWLAVQQRRVVA